MSDAERVSPSGPCWPALGTDVGNLLLSVAGGLVGEAVFVLAVLALAYYWLAEVSHFERVLLSALPPSARVRAREIWRDIEGAVGAYVRTTVVAVALAWLLLFAVYRAAGLPFAATLGLVGGLAHLVPGVGPVLGIIPAVLVALTLAWWQAILVLAAGVGVQLLAQLGGIGAMIFCIATAAPDSPILAEAIQQSEALLGEARAPLRVQRRQA